MTRPSLRWSAAATLACALAWGALLVAPGCRESPSDDESTRVAPELVTFNEHIAPIIFGVCAGCHRPGESAPFSLLSYDDVVKRAQLIAALTEIRFMPPWQPEFGYGEFVGERRLSDEQIDRIQRWVSQGSPEGEEVDLPPLPKWKSGWQLGEPDLVIEMPEPFLLPADGVDVFRNFVIPIPIDGERFVRAIELRPGNKRIVHHAIMRVDSTDASRRLAQATPEPGFEGMGMGASLAPDGRFLGWTPGRVPLPEGDEMAWRLRGPADLVLQLHMLPSGKPETIQSRVGFFFTDRAPTHQFHTIELDFRDIDIPPGETDYRLADRLAIPVDLEVHSLYPHAHYLGKEMKVFATLPDGDIRWLLWIKAWDFNWQDEYRFVEPVRLPAGSVLHVEFSYDNSAGNVRNPNQPPERVVYGRRSTDEMGTVTLQVLPERAADLATLKETIWRHMLAKYPWDPRASLRVGGFEQDHGDLDAAIGHYQNAVRIKPDYGDAHGKLAHALQLQGMPTEAIRHYRLALQYGPRDAFSHNNLGVILGSRGDVDQAVHHFRRALAIEPDDPRARKNLRTALKRRARTAAD